MRYKYQYHIVLYQNIEKAVIWEGVCRCTRNHLWTGFSYRHSTPDSVFGSTEG